MLMDDIQLREAFNRGYAVGYSSGIVIKEQEPVDNDVLILTYEVDESNKTLTPFNTIAAQAYTIDWGDGTITDNVSSYTYAEAGTKKIKVKCTNVYFISCSSRTNLIRAEGMFHNRTGSVTYQGCFSACKRLSYVSENIFQHPTSLVNSSFNNAFMGCESLKTIPKNLFKNHTNAKDFDYCFSNCTALEAIPSGLFDNIPDLSNFKYCFDNCNNLTGSAPELWLRHSDGYGCFYGCYLLDNYDDIPESWK